MSVVQMCGAGSYLRGLYCCRFSSMRKAESTSDARRLVDWLVAAADGEADATGLHRISPHSAVAAPAFSSSSSSSSSSSAAAAAARDDERKGQHIMWSRAKNVRGQTDAGP
jgi:hypothetical protein